MKVSPVQVMAVGVAAQGFAEGAGLLYNVNPDAITLPVCSQEGKV
jgi:hypothetical protein